VLTEPNGFKTVMRCSKFTSAVYWQEVLELKGVKQFGRKTSANTINPLAPELFFLILAHSVYKM